MHPQTLWKKRFDHYIQSVMGYWRVVGRSNFGGFLVLFIIVFSYYYGKTLQTLPASFPYLWIAIPFLSLMICPGNIRTLIREPDRIYLLPVETELSLYFQKAFRYSFGIQAFRIFAALILLWPLYRHCTGNEARPFLSILAFLLIMKATHLMAYWQETKWIHPVIRSVSVAYRWLTATLILLILFQWGVLYAAICTILAILIWLAVFRSTRRYIIGWEYLIDREKQHKYRLNLFFSWFMEVPELGTRVMRRRWMNGIFKRIPFDSAHTFHYLYAKSFIRSELFSMTLRTLGLAFMIMCVSSAEIMRGLVAIIAFLIITVQVSSIEHMHTYTFWIHMYPLKEGQQKGALVRITEVTLTAVVVLLSVPFFIRLELLAGAAWIILGLACALWAGRIRLKRKFKEIWTT